MTAIVRVKATELDVYVNGKRVGHITDFEQFWRVGLYGRRRRRVMPDYGTRAEAIRAVVSACTPRNR